MSHVRRRQRSSAIVLPNPPLFYPGACQISRLRSDIQAEIKPHLANKDQGENERQTDRQMTSKRKQQRTRNTRNMLSLLHRAGGWWADGIWKTGVFRRPPFSSPSKISHSPFIVVLPPAGGTGGTHKQ